MKHYKEYYAPINDLYREAAELIQKSKNLSYAEEIVNTLLLTHPNLYVLIFQLGNICMKKRQFPAAEVFFLRTLSLKPDFLECHNNIGYVYKEMQRMEEAKSHFKIALDIVLKSDQSNEEKSSYYHNYASTFTAMGTPKEAIPFINKAIELDPNNDDAYWNRGLAHLELGEYENGFADYEHGKRIAETKNRNYTKEITPFWDGTPGKTVVVYGEQGIGDELMFASVIPDLMKDCTVILDLHPRLADLFRHNYPNIPIFGTRKTGILPWTKYYNVDAKISIASLGKFYRKKLEDFPGTPYLNSPPLFVEKYKQRLDALSDKKKVGISWKGGSAATSMNERKVKLKHLLPILDVEGVDFISLQYHEDSPIHLQSLKENFGKTIHHWQEVLDDYDETAGLVSNLDYIISVPQSVVHLAGSLGVPTLQMCPKKAMWQMGPYGQNMPWYSCVENIWQDDSYTWEPVILKAKEKLCNLLQTST